MYMYIYIYIYIYYAGAALQCLSAYVYVIKCAYAHTEAYIRTYAHVYTDTHTLAACTGICILSLN